MTRTVAVVLCQVCHKQIKVADLDRTTLVQPVLWPGKEDKECDPVGVVPAHGCKGDGQAPQYIL